MTHPMPSNAPELMKAKAELDTLRWVVAQMYRRHQIRANNQRFDLCLCASCAAVRPFMMVQEPRFCDQMDEQEAVS